MPISLLQKNNVIGPFLLVLNYLKRNILLYGVNGQTVTNFCQQLTVNIKLFFSFFGIFYYVVLVNYAGPVFFLFVHSFSLQLVCFRLIH